MDGTLWDAIDTYCTIWNETYRRMGIDDSVTRNQLLECMGMPLEDIVSRITSAGINPELFYTTLGHVDDELMPQLGGTLYAGVKELIPKLSERYSLFMVSNCGPRGLEYFLTYTGLRQYFTDTLSFGQTRLQKEGNIDILRKKYGLASPVYIGDTQSDADSAHASGIPMIYAAYGFGSCSDPEYTLRTFNDIAPLLLQ